MASGARCRTTGAPRRPERAQGGRHVAGGAQRRPGRVGEGRQLVQRRGQLRSGLAQAAGRRAQRDGGALERDQRAARGRERRGGLADGGAQLGLAVAQGLERAGRGADEAAELLALAGDLADDAVALVDQPAQRAVVGRELGEQVAGAVERGGQRRQRGAEVAAAADVGVALLGDEARSACRVGRSTALITSSSSIASAVRDGGITEPDGAASSRLPGSRSTNFSPRRSAARAVARASRPTGAALSSSSAWRRRGPASRARACRSCRPARRRCGP